MSQKEPSRKIIKTNHDDKIGDEKIQYDIYREAAKTSALSPGNIHNFEYFTGEETLPTDQGRVID